MASHKRVLHLQRGWHMSRSYAEQVMHEHCSLAWVVEGESVRDTTDEERITLRAEQAQRVKAMAPLTYAELPGLTFEPPANGLAAYRESQNLIRAAHEFTRQAA